MQRGTCSRSYGGVKGSASDVRVRLHVAVQAVWPDGRQNAAASKGYVYTDRSCMFEDIVEGTASACEEQLELLTLLRINDAARFGFRLRLVADGMGAALEDAGLGPMLVPDHLYQAFIWNGRSRLDIWAEILPPCDRLTTFAQRTARAEHGLWVHKAVASVQRRWRAARSWRHRVDMADILGAFSLGLTKQGLVAIRPTPLLRPNERLDPVMLNLLVALAACSPSPHTAPNDAQRVFRWLEARAADFCIRRAADYGSGLGGLAEVPRCFGALRELTEALLHRLGTAFPWLLEPKAMEKAVQVATGAAQAAAQRFRMVVKSVPSSVPYQQLLVAQVHSEVVSWILDSVEDVLHDLEFAFQDDGLAQRISSMPGLEDAFKAFECLSDEPRSWLVRLESQEQGPLLLMPVEPGRHFGGVVRAACAFFGYGQVQLFLSGPAADASQEEPVAIESTPESLRIDGLMLRLTVHQYEPDPASFEAVLLELAKILGTRFSLDRCARVLQLPKVCSRERAVSFHNSDDIQQLSDLGETIVMPACYAGNAQYYHFYNSKMLRLTSVRCSLSTLLGWLRRIHEASGGADQLGLGFSVKPKDTKVEMDSLLNDLGQLHRSVSGWLQSSVGPTSWRNCGADFVNTSANGARAAVSAICDARRDSGEGVARLATSMRQHLGTEPPAVSGSKAAVAKRDGAGDDSWNRHLSDAAQTARSFCDFFSAGLRAAVAPQVEEEKEDADALESDLEEQAEEAEAASRDAERTAFASFFCDAAKSRGSSCAASSAPTGSTLASARAQSSSDVPLRQLKNLLRESNSSSRKSSSSTTPSDDDACCRSEWDSSDTDMSEEEQRGESRLAARRSGPDVMRPAVITAVACATPILANPLPQARWVLREMSQATSLSQALSSQATALIPHTLSGIATGAMAGASFGSSFGAVGAGLGAALGAVAGPGFQAVVSSSSSFGPDMLSHGYVYTASSPGKMMLIEREIPSSHMMETLAMAATAQALVRGYGKVVAVARNEMSVRDAVVGVAQDVRDGVVVWGTCQAIMEFLRYEAAHAGGVLGSVSAMVLQNPVPVLIVTLCSGALTVSLLNQKLGRVASDRVQADVVMTSCSNGCGLVLSVVGCYAGISPVATALVACGGGHLGGLMAYEMWRQDKQEQTELQLYEIAREVMGVAEDYDAVELRRRWRTFARLAHPDRNRCPQARMSFAVFSLCNEALKTRLERPIPRTCLRGLLRVLRRCSWTSRSDLPSEMQALREPAASLKSGARGVQVAPQPRAPLPYFHAE
eukprot:TRINITY_DN21930_c0_g1_i2.p1 TRINITY_DN21930_c0_g1~~TRINITY_DN21930_c0_g1_i2.p1  ORF type:complete len:1277 (-),score=213.53 TRINITY_DN21930_c0_g1_i2:99-3929(-)